MQEWLAGAAVLHEVMPCPPTAGEASLLAAQVTTRSPMGAIAYHCAGILIDHGWLRILGAGGHEDFSRSLPGWNHERSERFYLVADDAIGGFFAMNGGAFGTADPGKLFYFAPDKLDWEALGLGYSDFLPWALSGRMAKFYESERWPGWEAETLGLSADQAINIYPPLFSKGPAVEQRSWRVVPVAEQWGMQMDFRRQLRPQT